MMVGGILCTQCRQLRGDLRMPFRSRAVVLLVRRDENRWLLKTLATNHAKRFQEFLEDLTVFELLLSLAGGRKSRPQTIPGFSDACHRALEGDHGVNQSIHDAEDSLFQLQFSPIKRSDPPFREGYLRYIRNPRHPLVQLTHATAQFLGNFVPAACEL